MKNDSFRTTGRYTRTTVLLLFSLILGGCGQNPQSESVKDTSVSKEPEPGDPPLESSQDVSATAPPVGPVRAEAPEKPTVEPALFLEAALQGQLETIRLAIDEKMDVDAADDQGRTALMFASFNGHAPVVQLLLKAGATADRRDAAGRTALLFAATGDNVEAVKLLLDAGAEVNATDSVEGFTALMHAAAEGQLGVVQLLLKHKANPAIADVDGDTARDFATRNGHTGVVQLLSN